jgi:hypothetical protein
MTVHVVCGISLEGNAVEPMYEESMASYMALFNNHKVRSLQRYRMKSRSKTGVNVTPQHLPGNAPKGMVIMTP